MKTLKIEVPDQLAEFVHRHRFELEEQFQLEDIRWALSLKDVDDLRPEYDFSTLIIVKRGQGRAT